MTAPEPEQTVAACVAPIKVGLGRTVNVTFCVNDAVQFGVALVTVTLVICNV